MRVCDLVLSPGGGVPKDSQTKSVCMKAEVSGVVVQD